MEKYLDYSIEMAKNLLKIDSPSGYGSEVVNYLSNELNLLGVKNKITNKGGLFAEIKGKNKENAILLQAHLDTLGGMVHEIKSNGRLKITNIGGLSPNNVEAENVRIITRSKKIYEGSCQLINASVHVNPEYKTKQRNWDTLEIVIDEDVKTKEDVLNLGIMNGDYVCFEPRTRVTSSGYIKSRFLDDKLSVAILMAYIKHLVTDKINLERTVYFHFTIYEEVGHGGSNPCPENVNEVWSVDMGCVGDGLSCTEKDVSIAAKDSGGPYNYQVVSKLIDLSKKNNISYAVDIYPFYGSDVESTLSAGFDIKHALIGPGVYASHGYERSHKSGVLNTLKLIDLYIK